MLDLKPVELLLEKHRNHTGVYWQDFQGLKLKVSPDVFNPAYTKVSGLLAENIKVNRGDKVLDMFCGTGVLGLLASRLAIKIVGIDINPLAIDCATANALSMGVSHKVDLRVGDLWEAVKTHERFDLIIANPPLLPINPTSLLEMAVADSPKMTLMTRFVGGCHKYLSPGGRVLMTFSNACKTVFQNPLQHITFLARNAGLETSVVAEMDVGYEIYRVLQFNI